MLAVLALMILAFKPQSWDELKRAVNGACSFAETEEGKESDHHSGNGNHSETFVHMRDYCNNSAPQQQAAQIVAEMIERLAGPTIQARKMDGSYKLNVVEFGCATGNPGPVSKIKQAAGPSFEIKAVMNDLPLNDWKTLKENFASSMPDVEIEVACQSMYAGTVAPSGTVDISYSNFAQHWLSEGVPCPLPAKTGALWGNQLLGNAEFENILAKWSEASRKDWDRFLTLRADEMRKGGIMVLSLQSSDIHGNMFEPFAQSCQIAKRQCVEEGVLTKQEAEKMCVPEYSKSILEILEPLKSRSETWEILEVQHSALPCVHTSDVSHLENGRITSQNVVNSGRSFMDSSLERAFEEENIGKSKLDQFWQKVMDIGAEDASQLSTRIGMTYLALRRK